MKPINKTIRVFAPASSANLGCGFDVMGMALDGIGDVLRIAISEGDGLTIRNTSAAELPEDIEKNVITPAVRAFMAAAGQKGLPGNRRREKNTPRQRDRLQRRQFRSSRFRPERTVRTPFPPSGAGPFRNGR